MGHSIDYWCGKAPKAQLDSNYFFGKESLKSFEAWLKQTDFNQFAGGRVNQLKTQLLTHVKAIVKALNLLIGKTTSTSNQGSVVQLKHTSQRILDSLRHDDQTILNTINHHAYGAWRNIIDEMRVLNTTTTEDEYRPLRGQPVTGAYVSRPDAAHFVRLIELASERFLQTEHLLNDASHINLILNRDSRRASCGFLWN